jgi:hypothetical protein
MNISNYIFFSFLFQLPNNSCELNAEFPSMKRRFEEVEETNGSQITEEQQMATSSKVSANAKNSDEIGEDPAWPMDDDLSLIKCPTFDLMDCGPEFGEDNNAHNEERPKGSGNTSKASKATLINKKLREQGACYLGRSRVVKQEPGQTFNVIKGERTMKETCSSSFCSKTSKRSCQLFTEADRLQNFTQFWRLSWDEKKAMVRDLVESVNPSRVTKGNFGHARCKTLMYHLLTLDGTKRPVCKQMFCNTLGVSNNMVLRWVSNKKPQPKAVTEPSPVIKQVIKATGTTRKRTVYPNECPERVKTLDSFINRLPRVPSQYCHVDRQYLERTFYSIRQIHR